MGITIAIEEIEAWFFLVPEFFLSFDSALTVAKVNQILGIDLHSIDIETIQHPAQSIDAVLKTVKKHYKKRLSDSQKIAESINYEALYLQKRDASNSLSRFASQLESALP